MRLNETQIDQKLLEFCAGFRISDAEACQWFVEVIKAKVNAGQDQNSEHQRELQRQREQVNAKLQTPLDLRMDCEITAQEYAAKHREQYELQSAIALQLQTVTTMAARSPTLPSRRLNFHKAWENGGYRQTTKQNAPFSKACV